MASEALRSEKVNHASGEAEAIKLKAEATALGIDAVSRAIEEGGENAHNAISLSVAEKYVSAWSNLAREGTAVVVPGNVGDMGGMIANAMAVYGKVSETQARGLAKKTLGVEDASRSSETPHNSQVPTFFEEHTEQNTQSNIASQTADEGFETVAGEHKK